MPDQQRRIRIMELPIRLHSFDTRVRITVSAKMSAAVVRANIAAQQTSALSADPFSVGFRNIQTLSQNAFIRRGRHTAAAVRPERGQRIAFAAGTDRHTVNRRDPDQFLSDREPLERVDLADLREISFNLLIKVDKTDNDVARISRQRRRKFFERLKMKFGRIARA